MARLIAAMFLRAWKGEEKKTQSHIKYSTLIKNIKKSWREFPQKSLKHHPASICFCAIRNHLLLLSARQHCKKVSLELCSLFITCAVQRWRWSSEFKASKYSCRDPSSYNTKHSMSTNASTKDIVLINIKMLIIVAVLIKGIWTTHKTPGPEQFVITETGS